MIASSKLKTAPSSSKPPESGRFTPRHSIGIAHPLPGISIKTLRDAAEDEYRTLLVKMEPGTTYPTHRHKQREELFLIEGDLSLEGKTMGPGDYCFAEPESVHQTIKTASGAVFLVMHSTSDEFLGWRGVIQKLSHIF